MNCALVHEKLFYWFWQFLMGLFTAKTVFYNGNTEKEQENLFISDIYANILQSRSEKKIQEIFFYPRSAEKLGSVDDQKLKIN